MFAFENWHSALEMKLYIQRYIHHIGGLPDFTALRFTKYNQYESMILPMVKYLEGFGVQFHYGVQVTNVEFDCQPGRKLAKRIDVLRDGEGRGHRPDRERPRVHHERRLRRKFFDGQPERAGGLQHRAEAGRRLGHVAEDRRAGPGIRSSGQVLL